MLILAGNGCEYGGSRIYRKIQDHILEMFRCKLRQGREGKGPSRRGKKARQREAYIERGSKRPQMKVRIRLDVVIVKDG